MEQVRGATAQVPLGPDPERDHRMLEFARLSESLERVRARLSGVPQASGISLAARFETLVMLDDQARDIYFRIGRDQALIRQLDQQRLARFVAEGRDLFGLLLEAFRSCLDQSASSPPGVPALRRGRDCTVRMARAAADRVIWERVAGGPPHPHLWSWLGLAFHEAVRSRKDYSAALFGAVGHCATSVEREFLRAVAAQSASLDLLDPALVLPLGRLLSFVLPMLRLEASPFVGALYRVVPEEGVDPRRIVGPPSATGGWYFSPGLAVDSLVEVESRIPSGAMPARLASGERDEASLQSAIAHLVRHWSASLPVRRHRRHLLDGTLSAVRGLAQLKAALSGQGSVRETVWSLRDVSRGGLAAYAPAGDSDAPRVGELVVFRAVTGAGWQLGLVRRSWAEKPDEVLVGLEMLSQKPMRATVDDGRVRTDVVLCDPVMRGEAVRLAAERGAIAPDAPLFLTNAGGVQKLKPIDSTAMGEGFELRVYQVL